MVSWLHKFKKILLHRANLEIAPQCQKFLEEVTILLTKFTSANLEDRNLQKAANGAILTFIPFDKSL